MIKSGISVALSHDPFEQAQVGRTFSVISLCLQEPDFMPCTSGVYR